MVIPPPRRQEQEAFTLVEVLIATGVTLVLITVLLVLVGQLSDSVRLSRASADEFQVAQRVFSTLAERVAQATLNNYRDSPEVNKKVQLNQRMSELRFACGPMEGGANAIGGLAQTMRPGHGIFFQAATGRPRLARDPALLGLDNLINTWGYFVETGPDILPPPSFLPPETAAQRIAPRLLEMCEPTERLSIYRYTSIEPGTVEAPKQYLGLDWIRTPLGDRTLVHTLAENIAVLLIVPKLTPQETARLLPGGTAEQRDAFLAPQLYYHSGAPASLGVDAAHNMRHRLPALVELTMVALDGASVARLYGPNSLDPFQIGKAFHKATKINAELRIDPAEPERDSLERRLIDAHAHHRIFTTIVPIRAAQ